MTKSELIEQARHVVLAYQEANPMRTADMHPEKCGCLRCEIDRLEYVADCAEASLDPADNAND